ncbi:MAG: alkaline phosphatase family protein [Desulfomonilaceae bacterium]|nr:alkaline phosphatase family protein [Desulfomonilaceae bacterium]
MSTCPTKVAVLGLDGVPYTLLKLLFADRVMPHLARLAHSGAFLRMHTVLPPVSSTAWASFMTGANPGRHGIFGFTDLKPNERALHLPSFDDIRCPVIWQRLPQKRSVVVNLPFTFPARPLNGMLIAGFVAPDLERSVYPESLLPWLVSRNYRIDIDSVRGRQDRRALIADLFETLHIREEVILTLMEHEPWDLFIGVITGTDRLHHFFFDAYEDRAHPYHEDFVNYYRRLDAFIGRFVDRLGSSTRLMVLSDHGFTRLKTQVYLNHILKTMGHLAFTTPAPVSPEDIHPGSRAFAMEPTRVYLNCRDRFRNGSLSASEAIEFRGKLRSELAAIGFEDVGIFDPPEGSDSNERVFGDVLVKEDVYEGELLPQAPDLVVIPKPGYDVKAGLNPPGATMTDIFTGMHTHDDAFLIVDDPGTAQRLPEPYITDVAPLILEVLGEVGLEPV